MFRRSVQTNPSKLERKREKELGKTKDCGDAHWKWERKKEKNLEKRFVSKLLFDGREKFFAPRGIRMELASKRRGIEEREKFRPRYLPFAPLFALPSAGHVTRYRFFEENRKEEGTLFDHRSGRWPGFDDTFSLSLSLSLLLAKFENRWILVSRVFQSSSLPIWRSKSLLESNDILSRASSGPCRSLSTRTVRRFSGRAVESYIYIRLYSNFDRCNVFWR